MALSAEIVGKHYRYPDHYVVEREKIREYATAVQNESPAFRSEDAAAELGYDRLASPLTFTAVFSYTAQRAFFDYAHINLTDSQIVQVDQEFKFLNPIHTGDHLFCDVCTWTRCARRTAPTSSSPKRHHQPERQGSTGDLHDAGRAK